jgi:hypothetical protein
MFDCRREISFGDRMGNRTKTLPSLFVGESQEATRSIILVDSRVLRNKRLQTPSGPEGSSGSGPLCVPQGSLAINKLSAESKGTGWGLIPDDG